MTVLRRLRASRGGAAVIVTYHRMNESQLDPECIAVSSARFAEHVRAYAEHYTPMTVGDICAHLAEGRPLPRNAVAVTIDDGYVDCATVALPALQAAGVPATVFVVSGFVDSDAEMWWDQIERVCLQPGVLPPSISLSAAGVDFEYALDDGLELGEQEAAGLADWNMTKPPTHPRQNLYLRLRSLLHDLQPEQRLALLAELRAQTGVPAEARPANRGLTAAEVRELDASGLVEIGAHTVTHPHLSTLTPEAQRAEILGGKAALEVLLGHDVVAFSYPYGDYGSFTDATSAIVRETGLLGACTTELGRSLPWGSVSLGSERYELPRTASANVPASEMVALIDKRLGI